MGTRRIDPANNTRDAHTGTGMTGRPVFIIIVLAIVLTAIIVSGQCLGRRGEERINTRVKLVEIINDTKTVILLENEGFIVKTSLSDFQNYMENKIKTGPGSNERKELLEKVLEQAKSEDIIDVQKVIENEEHLSLDLRYMTASLLENGQCLILNTRNNKTISEIKIQTYSNNRIPLAGDGGRRFYANGRLILLVVDWIS